MDNRWYYVDFSRPEEINLNFDLVNLGGKIDGSGSYRLTLQPTNKFGKKLGPAQAHRIKVLIGQTALILEDKFDGSYEAVFSTAPGDNPTVSVYVIDPDTPVLERPVISGSSNFQLSAHSGYVTSLSSTTPLVSGDNGIYFEVDLAYAFDKNWAISLIGGSYQFTNNIDFTGATLFGEYTIRKTIPGTTGFYPRLAAGLGLYKPGSQNLAFSLGIRPGLLYQVTPRLELSIDAGIHLMFDPSYQLGYGGLGLRYRL